MGQKLLGQLPFKYVYYKCIQYPYFYAQRNEIYILEYTFHIKYFSLIGKYICMRW